MEEKISENKSEKNSSEDDDELDITSEKFNPLKALYSKKMQLPVKNAKRLDNLAIFEARLKKAGSLDSDLSQPISNQKLKDSKVNKNEDSKDDEKYHITNAGRKFLKEQAPVHRGKKAKFKRDLRQNMENKKGPLALLQKFKLNRTKVKIYVRKEHGIRGYLIGYILAFDKHCNLTLDDCTEVWKRRKYAFSESKVAFSDPIEDCSKLLAAISIEIPEISVKSLNRKNVECSRKLGQIMIRGEDVVLVGEFKQS